MDSNIKITPTSSTTTMARSVSTQPASLSSEKSKYGFRQQLKRFVGWGTSASKPKKPLLTPLTTHALDNASTPLTGSTLVSSSDMSFVSAPSTPLPPTPGTPHSIMLKSRLAVVDSRRTSEVTAPSEVAMSVISKSRLSTVSSISTCSVTTADLSTQEKVYISDSEEDSDDDDEEDDIVSAQEEIVVEEDDEKKVQKQVNEEQQQVSNVQGEQKQITNLNGEMKNVQNTHSSVESSAPSQSLTEQVVQDTTSEGLQTPTEVTATPPPPPPKTGGPTGEFNDIQAQYAMWMNSQPPEAPSPFAQLPPTPASSIHHSPITTITAAAAAAITTTPPTPTTSTPTTPTATTTTKNALKNKASVISEKSVSTAPSMINSSSSSSSSSSTCSGVTTINKPKQEREYQEPLHPMSSNNEQDIDDLFLLVAHGVEFLTTKENTKWEEEGGYEFHPWNRPHSSFAVRHHQKKNSAGNAKKQPNGVPIELTQTNTVSREQEMTKEGGEEVVVDEKQELQQEEGVDINHQDDHPLEDEENQEELASLQDTGDAVEEEVTSQESLVSVAKRILGAKSEPQPTQTSFNSVSNEHPSLDDDELQRIVAAHIVF